MHETFFFKKEKKTLRRNFLFWGLECWFWGVGFLMIGSQIPRHTHTETEAKVQQQHQALKDPPPQPPTTKYHITRQFLGQPNRFWQLPTEKKATFQTVGIFFILPCKNNSPPPHPNCTSSLYTQPIRSVSNCQSTYCGIA